MAVRLRDSVLYIDVRLPDGTRHRQSARGVSKSEATKLAKQLERGTIKPSKREAPLPYSTLRGAFDRGLSGVWKDVKSSDALICNIKIAEAYFKPDCPLESITTARVAEYIEHLQSIYTSPATINRKLATLKRILNVAHKHWGILAQVPAFAMKREPKGRMRLLSDSEESLLLSKAPQEMFELLSILIDTGCRLSEALNLKPVDIDVEEGYVRFWSTKDGSFRSVPIPERTLTVCRKLKLRQGFKIDRDKAEREWKKLKLACGITDKALVMHACRHTYATRMLTAGVSIYEVSKLLGHASVTTTERYAKVVPAHLISAVEKYNLMRRSVH